MEEKVIEYKKGDLLFMENENSKDLYIVQSGVVKVFKECDGKKLPIALVHSGQFVGELSFFDGKPRSATAECATDVKAIRLDQDKLEKEIKRLPSWLIVMIRSVADRLRETDEIVRRNKLNDSKMAEEFARWDKQQPAK